MFRDFFSKSNPCLRLPFHCISHNAATRVPFIFLWMLPAVFPVQFLGSFRELSQCLRVYRGQKPSH